MTSTSDDLLLKKKKRKVDYCGTFLERSTTEPLTRQFYLLGNALFSPKMSHQSPAKAQTRTKVVTDFPSLVFVGNVVTEMLLCRCVTNSRHEITKNHKKAHVIVGATSFFLCHPCDLVMSLLKPDDVIVELLRHIRISPPAFGANTRFIRYANFPLHPLHLESERGEITSTVRYRFTFDVA